MSEGKTMGKVSVSHAASNAEYVCVTYGLSHAKKWLNECGVDLSVFQKALNCRRKDAFQDEVCTIQANERWMGK